MKTFDKPLTAEDLEYLRSRCSLPFVDRQIELLGLAKEGKKSGSKGSNEADEAEKERLAAEEAEKARLAAEQQNGSENGGDGAEDLIGDVPQAYDILGATEAEVKQWVETASDKDKATALATEQAREDRDPRKGVVGLLGG